LIERFVRFPITRDTHVWEFWWGGIRREDAAPPTNEKDPTRGKGKKKINLYKKKRCGKPLQQKTGAGERGRTPVRESKTGNSGQEKDTKGGLNKT